MDFSPDSFQHHYQDLKIFFENDLEKYFQGFRKNIVGEVLSGRSDFDLLDSMSYSLSAGGKRFRPVLALAIAEALGEEKSKVLPLARCIEFIHTYSLIHDDLPALDNDDFRRGQPTNHKKFNEATALLAGDALLTESFGCLLDGPYEKIPALMALVIEAAGVRGMISGQALDLQYGNSSSKDKESLLRIHDLKTGRLIRLASEGSAVVLGKEPSICREYGHHLGMSFQIADDLLDQQDEESQNLVKVLGTCGAEDLLEYHVDQAMKFAQKLPRPEFLCQLALFNIHRKQ